MGHPGWGILVCASGLAAAAAPSIPGEPAAVFVSIGGEAADAEWSALCGAVLETLQLSPAVTAPERCARGHSPPVGLTDVRASGAYALWLEVEVSATRELAVRVYAWRSGALGAADHLVWAIPTGEAGQQRIRLKETLRERLRDGAKAPGAPFGVGPDPLASPAGERDYGAVALELGALLAVGSLWYGIATATNAPDWRYPYAWPALGAKLDPGSFELDDNSLHLNSPGHPLAGAAYYLSGRAHGFGVAGALGGSAAASFAWEYLGELREPVSINDLVMTPLGGLALGEPMYQLSRFFGEAEDVPANRILSGLFAGPSSLGPWRAREPARVRALDRLGYPVRGWRRIEVSMGLDTLATAGGLESGGALAFASEQILPSEYLGPGNASRAMVGPIATELRAGASFGLRGAFDAVLSGETVYAGWVGRASGAGWSAGWYSGASALYEHRERLLPTGYDRLGRVSPAGPVVHLRWSSAEWALRARASVHPCFAASSNRARAHGAALPDRPLSDVLESQAYSWELGAAWDVRAEVGWRGAELGVQLGSVSLAGLEDPLADRRLEEAAWLSHPLSGQARISARVERWVRQGTLGAAAREDRDLRLLALISCRL